MTKKSLLTLGVIAATSGALAAEPVEPEDALDCAPVTVRVWDRIPVEGKTLERAKGVAERVFRGSGVEVVWLDCADQDPTCAVPGPGEISLRLFRRPPAERPRTRDARGGMAVRDAGGGGIVHVFYDRMAEVASVLEMPVGLVLGITAAHEIGHLLLQPGHSPSGIMKASLEPMDWHLAAQGQLRFSASEAAVMRAGVCGPGPVAAR